MPEGDSIHRLAAKLRPAIAGKTIRRFEARNLAVDLTGRTVTSVEAQGKNLLVHLDDGRALHIHLRMLGRVFVGPKPPRFPSQLLLEVDGAFVTGTRIPVLRVLRRGAVVPNLGPDLLAADFDEDLALANLRAEKKREIGDAIMLQRAVAGIGNVYKSEVLFLERIAPRTPVSSLTDEQLRALLRLSRKLLQANLGSAPRRTRSTIGTRRYFVYGRAGKPCEKCGTPIERIYQGAPPGRSTYHCPTCQAPPGTAAP